MEPLSAAIISIRIWFATVEENSIKNMEVRVETCDPRFTSGGWQESDKSLHDTELCVPDIKLKWYLEIFKFFSEKKNILHCTAR